VSFEFRISSFVIALKEEVFSGGRRIKKTTVCASPPVFQAVPKFNEISYHSRRPPSPPCRWRAQGTDRLIGRAQRLANLKSFYRMGLFPPRSGTSLSQPGEGRILTAASICPQHRPQNPSGSPSAILGWGFPNTRIGCKAPERRSQGLDTFV